MSQELQPAFFQSMAQRARREVSLSFIRVQTLGPHPGPIEPWQWALDGVFFKPFILYWSRAD